MKRIFTFLLAVLAGNTLSAQHTGVMQEQSQYYSQFGNLSETGWDSLRHAQGEPAVTTQQRKSPNVCALQKRVFGWHPYWVGSVYNNYQWNLLSDLCYFDYAVSPTTGNNTNSSFQWSTSAAVTAAINNGTDVHICATLFGSHSTFWASSTAQQTFITNIISLLQARGGKGVNIDFEGMGSSDRIPFTNFMANLSSQLHSAIPGSELSMALYAVDWSNTFDIPNLVNSVDLFVIMGYDYYWSGSTTAGPDDPLYNFQTSYNYTLERSMTFYLNQGMPLNKLLLGLPYYGREWETTVNTIPGPTTGNYSATKTYAVVRNNTNGYYSTQHWDANSYTPYYVFQLNSNWVQCFINSKYSLSKRFYAVNVRGIGGIGIWALGYDDGYSDYWDAIEEKFTDCSIVACTDTLFDTGGPNRTYYSNEDYTYTIAPTGAYGLSLNFSAFNTELNYDTLYLYDGNSVNAPLIGAYHGTASPGTVTATGNAITLRFVSDGATVSTGWNATWTCSTDATAPTTVIASPPNWVTQNFTASFTDVDTQSGIEKSFYSVNDYNGTEWRGNGTNGFFNDAFVALNPEWTAATGTWGINSGVLEQADQNNTNTNIYASLTQNLSNRYCYHWNGKIEGTGNNRRAGFHFFCDNGSLTNRGNSYFVWFRVDQQALEIYKTINDVFYLQSSVGISIQPATWYDYKVFYDRITGKVEVYMNDIFIHSWIDSSPYSNGSYISFRSGNCNWQVDDFRVYRSRLATANISAGNSSSALRYQNPNPATPAGAIFSIVKDVAGNLSAIDQQLVNVDWTAPTAPAPLADGTASDIDTTFNLSQLQANWATATDPNSGLVAHEYAIGTTPGDSNVVAWTGNGLNTSVTHTGMSLTPGQWYYFAVRAENGAGLKCSAVTNDGQVAELQTSVAAAANAVTVTASPNPFSGPVQVQLTLTTFSDVEMSLYDTRGRKLAEQKNSGLAPGTARTIMDTGNLPLAPGMYLLRVNINGQEFFVNLAHL